MGNEFSEENEIKEKEPIEHSDDDYIKYGIISKKGGERQIHDTFLSFSDLESSKESKNKIHFGLFGVFDGHNNVYVAKYLSDNFKNFFEKEAGDINSNNYKQKIEEIFKTIDKELRTSSKKEEEDKNINYGIDEKEIKYYKDLIQNTNEIPSDLKNVEDSQIKDLLLFRNLFKYNNNYLYSTTDVDYIGSSASIVLVNNNDIITADLGITACILFDKEGKIINNQANKNSKENKDTKDLLKPVHVFENKSEKKRIKKFNEIEDYENLKYNIYAPASRCFGLFKYKADEILKEENQVISCIPEVNIYNRDSVDFILLMTKGMINLFKDNPNELIGKIIKQYKEKKGNEIKISEVLNTIIEERIKEVEENEKKVENKNSDKNINNIPPIKNNSIYVGREDFGEENEIINELKKNYYKDIMELNKNNCYSCHDKYNITCILMKISKEKYPIIEVKEVVDENKIEKEKKDEKAKDKIEKKEEGKEEEKKEEEKKEEGKQEEKKEEEKKEEGKEVEKKDENDKNEIKEINIDNEKQNVEEKINEPIEENKIEVKEEQKENKEDKNKIENNTINIDEENKNNEEKKEGEN